MSDWKVKGKLKNFLVKNYGNIGSTDGSRYMDINIKCGGPTLRDLAVGGGLITAGVFWMCRSAFFNGADRYYNEEYKVMEELGLFKN